MGRYESQKTFLEGSTLIIIRLCSKNFEVLPSGRVIDELQARLNQLERDQVEKEARSGFVG